MKPLLLFVGIALLIAHCLADNAAEQTLYIASLNQNPDSSPIQAQTVDWNPYTSTNYDTCQNQVDYLSFTITALTGTDHICKGCKTYNVCLTLTLPPDEFVQQTCVKNGTLCSPPDFSSYLGSTWLQNGVGLAEGQTENGVPNAVTANLGTQCQIGSNGTVLEFLIDDGRCFVGPGFPDYVDGAVKSVPPLEDPRFTPAFEFICHSRKYWNEQGSLNHTIGECCNCRPDIYGCVWRIVLPACTNLFETSPVTPSPSASPRCFCPPINKECSIEETIKEKIGFEHHIEITDCKDPHSLADYVNQMGIDYYHGSFGCVVSSVPSCNNIYCEKFVPEWIYSNFSTCPIASSSPSPSPSP